MRQKIEHKLDHTPTPWQEGEDWRIESVTPGGGAIVVCSERSVGDYRDRAFIVRACNSHEALLAALQDLVAAAESLRTVGDIQSLVRLDGEAQKAAAAIALAEGREP